MPRLTNAQGQAISLTNAQMVAKYWKDIVGSRNHYGSVRTNGDVIRELHNLVGINLVASCKFNMTTICNRAGGCGFSGDLGEFLGDSNIQRCMNQESIDYLLNTLVPLASDSLNRDLLTSTPSALFSDDVLGIYKEDVIGSAHPCWTAGSIKFLTKFESALTYYIRCYLTNNNARVSIDRVKEECRKEIDDMKKSVEQTKELLQEESKMNRMLENIIEKNGIELPKSCVCGEIYDPSECYIKITRPPRKVKVYDETTDTIVEEYETAGIDNTLWRPLFHHHYVKRDETEDMSCAKCIFADRGKGGSPCFLPTSKAPYTIGQVGDRLYEYAQPTCMCCVNPVGNSNCFVWNKSKYLVSPVLCQVVQEAIPPRKYNKGDYSAISPSDVVEITKDADIPVVPVVKCREYRMNGGSNVATIDALRTCQ